MHKKSSTPHKPNGGGYPPEQATPGAAGPMSAQTETHGDDSDYYMQSDHYLRVPTFRKNPGQAEGKQNSTAAIKKAMKAPLKRY